MVHHIFLITPQKLPNPGQLKTGLAVGGRAAAVDGPSLKLPPGLSRVHASDEGGEQREVVVVDQGNVGGAGGILGGVRT